MQTARSCESAAPRIAGVGWAIGAVLLWSQSAACLKIAMNTTSWLTVALWSTTAATVVYGMVALISGRAVH